MPDWEDALRRWLGGPARAPAPPDPVPSAPLDARPNWKAELLREAQFGWDADLAEPAADEADEIGPALAVPALVAPRLDLPRPFFTRHGYEPGKKPPRPEAMRALVEQVYGPCFAPLVPRMVADTPLFGALDSWRPGDERHNLVLMRILFERISTHLGDAYGFTPAPLGKVDHSKHFAGYYDHSAQKIFLGAAHLHEHVAHAVNTIAHEQTHRLQDLLVQAVTYKPRKLTSAQRSLALWWYDERPVDARQNYAAYRRSLREWHAESVGNAVAAGLGRVLGWPPEVLRG